MIMRSAPIAPVAHFEALCRGVTRASSLNRADRNTRFDRQRLDRQAPCAAGAISKLAR
jgi:hypothetical protein